MFPPNLAQHIEDLRCELSCGRDDECAHSVERRPFSPVEDLEHGNKEGERLAGSGFGRAEDVAALESEWDGALLDGRQRLEVRFFERLRGLAGQWEGGKEVGVIASRVLKR